MMKNTDTNNIKIKVCGLKHHVNIEDIASLNPDFMGFIFYKKSPRYALQSELRETILSLPKRIIKTGVFVDEELEIITKISRHYSLQAIQLHGNESPLLCKTLKDLGFIIIKAFGIQKASDFKIIEQYSDCCDYFLFDTKTEKHGGSGIQFNWELLKEYKLLIPFFLSGGIDTKDLESILEIKHPQLSSIDINSKFESTPGFKNIEKVKGFIEALRN